MIDGRFFANKFDLLRLGEFEDFLFPGLLALSHLKKSLWADGAPNQVAEGHLAAIWTLDHVIDTHPHGGVGGEVTVATLSKKNSGWEVEEMPEELIAYHRENIRNGVQVMADYIKAANSGEEK